MTLSFSKKFTDGTPTHFVEKIIAGMLNPDLEGIGEYIYQGGLKLGYRYPDDFLSTCENQTPKIHTIRADVKNRWRVGMKIHFVINNRTKDRFQFAPVLKVKSIQNISIRWEKEDVIEECIPHIYIGKKLYAAGRHDPKIEELAVKDGFPSSEQFLKWFSKDYNGKIIHWTHHKYS